MTRKSANRQSSTSFFSASSNASTEAHRRAFEALTSGNYDNFALFSCFCSDQPAAAIVAVNECPSPGENGEPVHIRPLFVSIIDGLALTAHDGREA